MHKTTKPHSGTSEWGFLSLYCLIVYNDLFTYPVVGLDVCYFKYI